jgi:hypothetical protein
MFGFQWFTRSHKKPAANNPAVAPPTRRLGPSIHLGLESLDDRFAPSATSVTAPVTTATTATATHFLVITPEEATAGSASPVEVVALTASNQIAWGYTGTVQLTNSDTSATVPAAYTFTSADHGIHVFTETPTAVGTDTVTATDSSTSSITGSATLTVDAAPVATHFAVLAMPSTYAGTSAEVVVVALDASNHVVPNYTGTVQLTSSDTGATLPASYTFTSADHGVHAFNVTFATTGNQTVTATDTSTSSITGSASVTVDAAPVATHFAVIAMPSAYAGTSTQLLVVALDASNHVVPDYTGTVQLTSSDSAATLPASYTFTAADHGVHAFAVTFATTGSQTVTATGTSSAGASVSGSATLTVDAAQVATHFAILTQPYESAGSQTEVVVVALDASNHVVSGYTGTVQLTSSDTAATLPASYTFTAADNGIHEFNVTLATTGTQTITATDTSNSALSATASVTVGSKPTGRGHYPFFV